MASISVNLTEAEVREALHKLSLGVNTMRLSGLVSDSQAAFLIGMIQAEQEQLEEFLAGIVRPELRLN